MPLPDVPTSVLPEMAGNNALAKTKSTAFAASGKLVVMANAATMKARAVLGEICNNKSAIPPRIDESEKKHAGGLRQLNKKEFLVDQCTGCTQDGVQDPKVGARRGSFSSQNLMVDDIDTDDNPQLVSIYVKDIYKYLNELEEKTVIKANFMEACSDIRPHMRSTLMDWLIEVHQRFKLLQETLYLAVSIIDRYVQAVPTVARSEYQLIGMASLLIAAKFEEMISPEVHDFVYMTDRAYTLKDILRAEIRILKALDFNLGRPLPLHFLRRYTKAASFAHNFVDVLHHTLSKYLLELSLIDYKFCQYLPSKLAAAALCLSLKILDETDTPAETLWSNTLIFYSGYTYESLLPVMGKFSAVLIKAETSKCQTVRRKYSSGRQYQVSILPQLKSPHIVAFLGRMALQT